MTAPLPALSVCLVTYERPIFVQRCVDALLLQHTEILQIVVVDASSERRPPHGLTPTDTYVHAPNLAGWMTRSRNRALLEVKGDLIAFLDDDVVVHAGWAHNLRRAFAETDAAALAGRTLNGQPGEEVYDKPQGRLQGDGTLTEGFAALTEGRVQVDHGIGANMCFRRDVLADLGGFRDDYPGTALREDTDIFLRIRKLGLPAYFDPAVTVDHLPAPHVRGARFDTRYKLYGRRNHMVLLGREGGLRSPMLRRWLVREVKGIGQVHGARRRAERTMVTFVGLAFGTWGLLRQARLSPTPARRVGPEAEAIRRALASHQ